MEPITIPFITNNLGRVDFLADVMTSDNKSFDDVWLSWIRGRILRPYVVMICTTLGIQRTS